MGMICPLQNAQPFGGKLNGKMRISATNGSAILLSPSDRRRELPEQRNDEIDAEVRLEAGVGLAPARRAERPRRPGPRRRGGGGGGWGGPARAVRVPWPAMFAAGGALR